MNLDAIPGFDPRAEVANVLNLVDVETTEGSFGFLVGTDGKFTDVNGKVWWGSTILSASAIESALNGASPSGTLSLSYFQDPSQPDLIAQLQALGPDYVIGNTVTFYWQPLLSVAEFYAPTIEPQRLVTRTIREMTMRAAGAQDRVITLGFESWAEDRRTARRITFSQEGHEQLLGTSNPSLEFRPTDVREDEKLFG